MIVPQKACASRKPRAPLAVSSPRILNRDSSESRGAVDDNDYIVPAYTLIKYEGYLGNVGHAVEPAIVPAKRQHLKSWEGAANKRPCLNAVGEVDDSLMMEGFTGNVRHGLLTPAVSLTRPS